MTFLDQTAEVVERKQGFAGEIQLQRRGHEYEIIYNGVFLMASYNGASEKAAVKEALNITCSCNEKPANVLIGGLGMGCSLKEALDCKRVDRVKAVEIEPAIIEWNRKYFRSINGNALDDPRTEVANCDLHRVLEEEAEKALIDSARRYRAIMIDTDNGSSWLSLPGNAFFYSEEGLRLIEQCLHPGGAASFWCSRREMAFEKRLSGRFGEVSFHTVPEKTGRTGCYYLAVKAGQRVTYN